VARRLGARHGHGPTTRQCSTVAGIVCACSSSTPPRPRVGFFSPLFPPPHRRSRFPFFRFGRTRATYLLSRTTVTAVYVRVARPNITPAQPPATKTATDTRARNFTGGVRHHRPSLAVATTDPDDARRVRSTIIITPASTTTFQRYVSYCYYRDDRRILSSSTAARYCFRYVRSSVITSYARKSAWTIFPLFYTYPTYSNAAAVREVIRRTIFFISRLPDLYLRQISWEYAARRYSYRVYVRNTFLNVAITKLYSPEVKLKHLAITEYSAYYLIDCPFHNYLDVRTSSLCVTRLKTFPQFNY